MLECAIHPITYKGEGILATVVKMYKKNPGMQKKFPTVSEEASSSGYLQSTFVTWFKSIGYLQLKQGTYLIRLVT
jgi:hypothetical protein